MNPKPRRAARRSNQPSFRWHAPSGTSLGLLVLGAIIGAGMWRQWVCLLDTFTLMLHEAGHPIVGLLSAHMMVYGGTFFQLLFPWLTKRHFAKRGHIPGVVFAKYWMAASLHNVGIYMADARAKQLPLIGGLDPEDAHDWAEILGRWGLLRYDTALGKMLMLAAWCALLWTMWRCYRDMPYVPVAGGSSSTEDAFVAPFLHLREKSRTNSNGPPSSEENSGPKRKEP